MSFLIARCSSCQAGIVQDDNGYIVCTHARTCRFHPDLRPIEAEYDHPHDYELGD